MRRLIGAALFIVALAELGYVYFKATDFPTEAPIERVDEALVRRLRENPGLHLALSASYRMEVALALVDDASNRQLHGTEIDLREAVSRRAIHIQKKGMRLAIHADDYNPTFGLLSKLLHGTLDLPVIPWIVVGLLGLGLLLAKPGKIGG